MPSPDPPETLKIRKYPNRRFYDATRSRHVTLDELHKWVRGGGEIQVTDMEGRDITNIVLTQILLEHDPPKLDLFPASLLHQAVQANQAMVRRFIDEYFSKAMDLFLNSRKQFDAFLAQSGLSPLQPLTPFDWARKFLQGFDQRTETSSAQPVAEAPSRAAPDRDLSALRAELDHLKAELAGFTTQRRPRKKSGAATSNPKRKPRSRGR